MTFFLFFFYFTITVTLTVLHSFFLLPLVEGKEIWPLHASVVLVVLRSSCSIRLWLSWFPDLVVGPLSVPVQLPQNTTQQQAVALKPFSSQHKLHLGQASDFTLPLKFPSYHHPILPSIPTFPFPSFLIFILIVMLSSQHTP